MNFIELRNQMTDNALGIELFLHARYFVPFDVIQMECETREHETQWILDQMVFFGMARTDEIGHYALTPEYRKATRPASLD